MICHAVDRFSQPTAAIIVSAATAVAYAGTTPMRSNNRHVMCATARITRIRTATYGQ